MFLPVPPKKNFFAQKYYKVTNKEAILSKNIDWQNSETGGNVLLSPLRF